MSPGARTMLVAALLLLSPMVVADFSVSEAGARLDNGVFQINADIDFDFSDKAREALDNGVPLTLVVDVRVVREDAWFWESDVVRKAWRYELRYHPLAGFYSVASPDTGIQERFATREAAQSALGRLHSIDVVDETELEADQIYQMKLRAYLDIESLPLPLRPLAYVSPGWNLSTGWSRWRLRP